MTRLTRRGTLALLGTLTGCSAMPNATDEAAQLDGAALRALADEPAPTIPDRLPVGIGEAHLEATAKRAQALFEAVPATLGPEQIPNGAIREKVHQARERAAESLSNARAATAPYERLRAFADARAEGRFAAGAWRAIDQGLTRAALRDEAERIRGDHRALRERWQYVGGDPVDATLVHAAIERRVDAGRADIALGPPRRYRVGNPLGVGELAEEVERARVAVDDAGHLYDRLTASVTEPTDLRPRFRAARESLRDDFESERADMPSVGAERPWQVEGVDVEDTPAAEALRELYRQFDPEHDDGWAEAQPAQSLLWAHGSFASLQAFASLRATVADGETFAVESVDDVAAMRTAAVEAVRAAAEAPHVPALTRQQLAELSTNLGHADDRLADVEGTVSAERLHHEVARYLTVAAKARATPRASERVASALRD
ncbi:MAG: hypothetical protein ABEJ73_04165 [Haloplanus sp.]